MTTSFELPDPSTPKVLADLVTDSANKSPFAPPAADNNTPAVEHPATPDPSTGGEADNPASEEGDSKNTTSQALQHHSNTDPAPTDTDDQTYTTTDPGFPIGQLIAGLVSAGLGAGTAAAGTLISLPTIALSTAMPILQSLLTLLGTSHLPSAAPASPIPPPPGARTPEGFTGPAADQHRQKADEHAHAGNAIADNDTKANHLVDQAHAANAQARHIVRQAINDLQTAAAVSAATGPAAVEAASRTAVHTARTAVAAAAAEQQTLAQHLAAIPGHRSGSV